MNYQRIMTWAGLIIVLGLIVWGLVAANDKATRVAGPIDLPVEVSSSDWITGSTTSPVTLVEYSDFQCPACEAYHTSILKKLIAEEGSKFRFVYRHFPLPQHSNAYPAVLAAEAAGKQGKFWEMHGMIFDTQKEWEDLATSSSAAMFADYGKKLGLNMQKFAVDVADQSIRPRIEESTKAGAKAGIYGTPTFFLNGKSIENPRSYEEFKALVEKPN